MHIIHTNRNTRYVLQPGTPVQPDPAGKRTSRRRTGPRLSAGRSLQALLALLALGAPAAALALDGNCPGWPQPPEFVAEVVAGLEQLQSHEERWQPPARWQQLTRELADLRMDGLSPGYYQLPELVLIAGRQSETRLPAPCHAGLATLMLAWSVKDLALGRLDPETLGLVWHQRPNRPEPEAFASEIHRALQSPGGVETVYNNARPDTPAYRNLRRAYRDQLDTMARQWPQVSPGPTLRAGDHDERVQQLARRLIAQGYLQGDTPWPGGLEADVPRARVFDGSMEAALANFQRDHGLTPDGLAGAHTRAALNLPPAAWAARVRANLERMRWYAPYQQPDQLLVDIAGARVTLYRDGQPAWEGRAQVGRAERKTPALTSTVSHVTINPTWTIPPTIFYEDALPAIRSDPDYLARNRLTVLDRSGTPLDPDQVDWSRPGSLLLRQAAGPGNALGEVAIRFPNPFSVYLHDTPAQRLFGTPERFYSSGCVRVEGAVSLTDQLFAQPSSEPSQRLKQARRTGDTRNISLPRGIALVMAYWTAQADDSGHISFRRDTYEEDEQLIDLLDAEVLALP